MSLRQLQRVARALLTKGRGGAGATGRLLRGPLGSCGLGPADVSRAGLHTKGPLAPLPCRIHSDGTPFLIPHAQCWPGHPFLHTQAQPQSLSLAQSQPQSQSQSQLHFLRASQVTAPPQPLYQPRTLLHSGKVRPQEAKSQHPPSQPQSEQGPQSQGASESQSQGASESQSQSQSQAQAQSLPQDAQRLLESGQGEGARQPPRYFRSGPVTWGSLGLLLLTGAGLLYYFEQEKQKRLAGLRKVRSVGKAAIGGPIRLINDQGKAVTEADLKGQWNLLYFGFTFCPDICPAELEKMAAAIDLLEKKHGLTIQPVFISIDPERDTVEQVKAYVKEFHPRMLGLTGTVDSVKAAAREFRVYYMKTEEEGDDYLVDHSIIMYLMSPQWEFVKFFGRNHTADSLADGIASEIAAWGSQS